MSSEVKIGLLATIVLIGTIWGYKYLKGQNLLKRSNYYTVKYKDVQGLETSNSVTLKGFKIGSIVGIELDPEDLMVTVTMDVDEDFRIPKNTEALLTPTGIMGGLEIQLDVKGDCRGADCAQEGEELPGRVVSFLTTMLPESEVDSYVNKIETAVTGSIDGLSDSEEGANISKSLENLPAIMNNLVNITNKLNKTISGSTQKFEAAVENLNAITANIAAQDGKINATLSNLEATSINLKSLPLTETVASANATVDNIDKAVLELKGTLESTSESIGELGSLIGKVKGGEGTLGKLIVDDELYDNLNHTSKNLDILLQDLRLNPKRYVNVSVFGKKQKEYAKPEDDPAFN